MERGGESADTKYEYNEGEQKQCEKGDTVLFVFFFKQKTAYEIRNCDWSSDVCSSDLGEVRN